MEPSQLSASSASSSAPDAPASAPDASSSAPDTSASAPDTSASAPDASDAQNSPASQDYYIDPTLYDGRPSDCSGRLNKEILTYDLLDQLRIPYKRLDHDAMPTIEACHQVDKLLGIEICKNLFLTNAQKTKFYLLLMPGTKKFKTKDLSKQIGSARLSFAGPEYMERFLDITPGSVSILGLMNDKGNQVQLIIDKDVIEGHPYIGCHPCINTSSLRIKTSDILEHFLPAVHHSYLLVDLPSEE